VRYLFASMVISTVGWVSPIVATPIIIKNGTLEANGELDLTPAERLIGAKRTLGYWADFQYPGHRPDSIWLESRAVNEAGERIRRPQISGPLPNGGFVNLIPDSLVVDISDPAVPAFYVRGTYWDLYFSDRPARDSGPHQTDFPLAQVEGELIYTLPDNVNDQRFLLGSGLAGLSAAPVFVFGYRPGVNETRALVVVADNLLLYSQDALLVSIYLVPMRALRKAKDSEYQTLVETSRGHLRRLRNLVLDPWLHKQVTIDFTSRQFTGRKVLEKDGSLSLLFYEALKRLAFAKCADYVVDEESPRSLEFDLSRKGN